MLSRCFRFPVLLLLTLGFTLRAAEPAALSLEGIYSDLERVNTNVLLAVERVRQAEETLARERAGLLPRLSLDGEQRRSRQVQVGRNGAEPTVNAGSPGNRFDGAFSANLSLLDPQQIAIWRAARLGVESGKLDLAATLQSALNTVTSAYFTHERNLLRRDLFDANIDRARALLELARNRLDSGVATQIDVTRAEAQLAVSQQARLQQETATFGSELFLKRLLSLDPARPLVLEPFVVTEQPSGESSADLVRERFAPTPYESRADWLFTQKLLEQTRLEQRAARLARVPKIGLSGEYGVASAVLLDGREKETWFASLTATVPLFDAGRISSNVRLAASRARSQELRLRDLERAISSEQRLAEQDARSRAAQIVVARKNRDLAREELRLAQLRFEQGVADNREIIDAQNNLVRADDNFVEALYQYNLSRLELARSRGDVRSLLAERDSAPPADAAAPVSPATP